MLIDLSESDGRPIYGRIADRMKFAIAGEVLRPGELVPSVRELSKQLVVNPNTVARAYRDLQGEGLLEPVRGTGLAGRRRGDGAMPAGAGGLRPRPVPRGLRRGPRDGPSADGGRGDPPRGVVARRGPGGSRPAKREGGLTVDEQIAIAIDGVSKFYRDAGCPRRAQSLGCPRGRSSACWARTARGRRRQSRFCWG